MTSLPRRAGRRCHNVLNPLHSVVYFAEETAAAFRQRGLSDPSATYLVSRSAAMGAVGAGTVSATFHNFNPQFVARYLPAAWERVSPEEAVTARLDAVDATFRRLFGDTEVASQRMVEAAELALRATEGCARPGRPLYAAHADIPVPTAPHLAFWHAATLLREHRGDGHVALLVQAELDGLEALVSHTASGRGMRRRWVLATRGWTEEHWRAAAGRLRERGLLDGDGELTEAGDALRADLEERTDLLDRAPYERLGADGVARLTELASGFAARAVDAGAFPADLLGKG